jgi:hypothetical protein
VRETKNKCKGGMCNSGKAQRKMKKERKAKDGRRKRGKVHTEMKGTTWHI